jgi:hypothetical protein
MNAAGKWLVSLLLLGLAGLGASTVLDDRAESYYDEAFKRGLVTFALARALNGAVSVIQGTEIALQPAGVGVTLTPGEIVDPINDLIERFSWVMLASTTSLGMQRLMLEISASWGLRILVVAVLVLAVAGIWRRRSALDWGTIVRRLAIIVLFLRFAVPAGFIVNTLIYDAFMADKVTEAQTQIQETTRDVEAMEDVAQEPEESSVLDSFKEAFDRTAQTVDVRRRVTEMR